MVNTVVPFFCFPKEYPTFVTFFHVSRFNNKMILTNTRNHFSGFGGLEVACWPLVPKFAGSNTAEAVGYFRAKKSRILECCTMNVTCTATPGQAWKGPQGSRRLRLPDFMTVGT
jgi:hypothetical protein